VSVPFQEPGVSVPWSFALVPSVTVPSSFVLVVVGMAYVIEFVVVVVVGKGYIFVVGVDTLASCCLTVVGRS
jgi:hypothetical protein